MPEILHQVRIKAAPDQIYAALTEPGGLANWWTRDTLAEAKVGSIAQFGFNQRRTVFKMRIEQLVPAQKVAWTCLAGDPEWEGTELVFALTPEGEETVLHFSHLNWKSTQGILAMCSFDWARYLMSLRSYLEIGQGHPHQG